MSKNANLGPQDNILLLEDMDNIRKQMIQDLKEIGHEAKIHEAATFQEALELCRNHQFNLIISDWNLPNGNGLDFLKKIKASRKFLKTPFLMCTTMDDVSNILSAVEAGANDYLVKPWNKEELEKKIESILN